MASLQRQPPTSDTRDGGGIRQRLLIVSDLHMATPGGPYPDPFAEDAAFAVELARGLVAGRPGPRSAAFRAATAFYAFGHTHVARDLPLRDGPAGHRYLNAGTWSTMRRDGQPESGDRLRFIE